MNHIQHSLLKFAFAAGIFATLWALFAAAPALAHTRIEVGPYVVVIGWEKEPVIVGERNAILLEITEDEAPVEGAAGTLDLALEYAGRTYRANLAPAEGKPGRYLAEVYPTVRGQYEVHLTGMIGQTQVDERAKPEEVASADVLQFPEAQPDARELNLALRDLEARLGTAYALAVGGITVGVMGLGLAAFALIRRR